MNRRSFLKLLSALGVASPAIALGQTKPQSDGTASVLNYHNNYRNKRPRGAWYLIYPRIVQRVHYDVQDYDKDENPGRMNVRRAEAEFRSMRSLSGWGALSIEPWNSSWADNGRNQPGLDDHGAIERAGRVAWVMQGMRRANPGIKLGIYSGGLPLGMNPGARRDEKLVALWRKRNELNLSVVAPFIDALMPDIYPRSADPAVVRADAEYLLTECLRLRDWAFATGRCQEKLKLLPFVWDFYSLNDDPLDHTPASHEVVRETLLTCRAHQADGVILLSNSPNPKPGGKTWINPNPPTELFAAYAAGAAL